MHAVSELAPATRGAAPAQGGARVGAPGGTDRATSRAPRPPRSRFALDVLEGLGQRRRRIPCTHLYDRRGSQLFEQITELPEYYLARTEIALLKQCAGAIAEAAGPRATLIELGSGPRRRTPLMLAALDRPSAYIPIDVSEQVLAEVVAPLAASLPHVAVAPVAANFTELQALPLPREGGRRIVFFPGGTIGNLTPEDASKLLERMGRLVGLDALLVVGVDHTRDPAALVAAYDDRAGITAAFNKNLLRRINRELAGTFALDGFRHLACFNAAEPRVEMHLVATRAQRATVLGHGFEFAPGESIHTGNAYKPSLFQFLALAHRAGWAQRQLWMGAAAGYAVHVLENVLAL